MEIQALIFCSSHLRAVHPKSQLPTTSPDPSPWTSIIRNMCMNPATCLPYMIAHVTYLHRYVVHKVTLGLAHLMASNVSSAAASCSSLLQCRTAYEAISISRSSIAIILEAGFSDDGFSLSSCFSRSASSKSCSV